MSFCFPFSSLRTYVCHLLILLCALYSTAHYDCSVHFPFAPYILSRGKKDFFLLIDNYSATINHFFWLPENSGVSNQELYCLYGQRAYVQFACWYELLFSVSMSMKTLWIFVAVQHYTCKLYEPNSFIILNIKIQKCSLSLLEFTTFDALSK